VIIFCSIFYDEIKFHFRFFITDKVRGFICILTFLVITLLLIITYKNINFSLLYLNLILLLRLVLISLFNRTRILTFYFLFEISIIPLLIIIIIWGYQPERLQASFYLIFYTVTASLPLLVSILFLFNQNNSFSFLIRKKFFLSSFI